MSPIASCTTTSRLAGGAPAPRRAPSARPREPLADARRRRTSVRARRGASLDAARPRARGSASRRARGGYPRVRGPRSPRSSRGEVSASRTPSAVAAHASRSVVPVSAAMRSARSSSALARTVVPGESRGRQRARRRDGTAPRPAVISRAARHDRARASIDLPRRTRAAACAIRSVVRVETTASPTAPTSVETRERSRASICVAGRVVGPRERRRERDEHRA